MIPATDIRKSIDCLGQGTCCNCKLVGDPIPEAGWCAKEEAFPWPEENGVTSYGCRFPLAGAMVHLQGKKITEDTKQGGGGPTGRAPQSGRYGQFSQDDPSSMTVLRAPGLAWKIEFTDNGIDDPSLNAEVKISASSNVCILLWCL